MRISDMSTKKIEFRAEGEPRPKQSFRVVRDGGKVRGFTDKKVKEWQESVAWSARSAMAGGEYLDGKVRVELLFELSNKRRVDCDNLSKAVLDSCNGVIWQDDSAVVDLHIRKIVSKTPGVTVVVEQIEDKKNMRLLI